MVDDRGTYVGRKSFSNSSEYSGFGGKRGCGGLRDRGSLVTTGVESICAGPGVAKGLNARVCGCRSPDEGREVSDDIPRRVSATGEYDGEGPLFSRDAGIGRRGDRRFGGDKKPGGKTFRLRGTGEMFRLRLVPAKGTGGEQSGPGVENGTKLERGSSSSRQRDISALVGMANGRSPLSCSSGGIMVRSKVKADAGPGVENGRRDIAGCSARADSPGR